MIKPKLPANESDRISALKNYQIIDSLSETEYDNIVKLASNICETPISLISFIDTDRQWFKAKVGIETNETPRDIAFCAHAILESDTVFEIPNAHLDKRFKDNPLVKSEPKIAFYAGASLVDNSGFALGTLCVIDTKPKELTFQQKESLSILAKNVVTLLELRKKNKDIERLNDDLINIIDDLDFWYNWSQNGIITFDALTGDILFINEESKKILDLNKKKQYSILQFIEESVLDNVIKSLNSDAKQGVSLVINIEINKVVKNLSIVFSFTKLSNHRKIIANIKDLSAEKNNELLVSELAEKEILINEIHHRVKNTFQKIVGLLNMQRSQISNKSANQVLKEMENRIMAMSLVHEILYQSNLKTVVNCEMYANQLMINLLQSYGATDINYSIDMDSVKINHSVAINCGIILNELVSNSIKYAFENITNPLMKLSIKKLDNNDYILQFSDNGVGIKNQMEINKLPSLGLKLINGLAKQMRGSFDYYSENGSTFIVKFSDKN